MSDDVVILASSDPGEGVRVEDGHIEAWIAGRMIARREIGSRDPSALMHDPEALAGIFPGLAFAATDTEEHDFEIHIEPLLCSAERIVGWVRGPFGRWGFQARTTRADGGPARLEWAVGLPDATCGGDPVMAARLRGAVTDIAGRYAAGHGVGLPARRRFSGVTGDQAR